MKSQPIIFSAEMVHALLAGRKTQTRRKVKPDIEAAISNCPYGQAGDELWVREGFANASGFPGIAYRSDVKQQGVWTEGVPGSSCDWISPIFMPRSLSRITLKITEVSIERVQDISEQDAIAEGLIYNDLGSVGWRGHKQMMEETLPVTAYQQLWDSLAKPGYQWKDNPLVWVVKFEVLK